MNISGKNIAITRGPEDAAEFTGMVESKGGRSIPLPTIRLVGRGDSISEDFLRECQSYDPHHTVFMSSRAVRILLEDARARRTSDVIQMAIANTNVVSVGPKTSIMLEKYGISTNAMPKSVYSSVGIGEVLSRESRSKNRVLVPRSGSSTPFLRQLLNKLGFDVREIYLYDAKPHPGGPIWEEFAGMLYEGIIHGMVFTSVSSVRAFFEIMAGMSSCDTASLLGKVSVVSIGPFTSEELDRFGVKHYTSKMHTVAGSLDTLQTLP